jgi:GNAT superfamily N-acetyltransferase
MLLLKGHEITSYIQQIALLRITVYRDYPYLYDGTMSYEEKYIQIYSNSKHSICILAQDNQRIIGAAIGFSLVEAGHEFQKTFENHATPLEKIFYLGEIMLLKEYRHKGLGHALYNSFEKAVRSTNQYAELAICEVIRSENDPKKPLDYVSLDKFWADKGFIKHSDLSLFLSWKDVGQEKVSTKSMRFWIKSLS